MDCWVHRTDDTVQILMTYLRKIKVDWGEWFMTLIIACVFVAVVFFFLFQIGIIIFDVLVRVDWIKPWNRRRNVSMYSGILGTGTLSFTGIWNGLEILRFAKGVEWKRKKLLKESNLLFIWRGGEYDIWQLRQYWNRDFLYFSYNCSFVFMVAINIFKYEKQL